tara:strand:- start:690 stop:950 length:261 start_codon:yes stop_codon:yes gene_type:complete
MIIISVVQRGYSDSTLYGPFNSVDEGKKKVTDGVTRGHDGDETTYTFFEVKDGVTKEIGYVRLDDECEGDEDNLRSENFYNNVPND